MATGDLGPVIESALLTLGDGGNNETGNLIFRVGPNIYLIVYRGLASNDMRFATLSINEANGDIDPTIIEESSVQGSYSVCDNFAGIVIQIPNTQTFITSSGNFGNVLTVRTVTCNPDGTGLALFDSQTFTGGSSVACGLLEYIAPSVIGVGVIAGSPRFLTIAVDDAGNINPTPIQAAANLPVAGQFTYWTRARANIAVMGYSTGFTTQANTFTVNVDGTFDTTILDGPHQISGRGHQALQCVSLDKSAGITVFAGQSQNFSNRIEEYIRITVDPAGILSSAIVFSSQNAAINKYRPTTFHIGEGIYLFLNEGSNIIRTINSAFGAIDTEAVPAIAGTKGVAFALVSPTIGAMLHIGTNAAATDQYLTTFSLVNSFGGGATPVAISAQVAMQQRELLLF